MIVAPSGEILKRVVSLYTRRGLAALLSASLLAQPAAWAQVNLPALGDSVSAQVGIGEEKRLGDQVMRQIRIDPDYLDDPLLLEYVQASWAPLVQAAKRLGNISEDTADRFAWEVFLVRDRSVNAFALPGGYVGVHLGLIAMTSARDEMASVLGHELSHITQRHIARSIIGDSRTSLMATAGLLLGILAAARSGNIDVANAAIVGSQAAAAQAQLNFSRDMEREADRVGFQVMTQAGYAPGGMASMFERMEQAYHLMDSGNYPYLRSHPLTAERIGDARARLGTQPSYKLSGTAEHALMAARSRVLMDQRAEAWRQLQGLDAGTRQNQGWEPLAARYTSALASIKLREFGRAESALKSADSLAGLLGADAGARRLLVYLRAELELARGQASAGLAVLGTLGSERSRPRLMLQAQLARAGASESAKREAADALQTHLSLHADDALGWQEIGPLWDQLGQPLRALRAQGEARAALGDIQGAIDRLRSGLRQSRGREADQIEAAVIDARLRALLYERRQQLAEMYPRGVPSGMEPQ